jgi:mannose-6-phosphate isomerase-like protein (cupin superfamily)
MSRSALVMLLGAVVFLQAPAAVTEPAHPPAGPARSPGAEPVRAPATPPATPPVQASATAPIYAPATGPAGYFVKTAASIADVEKTLQGKGGRAAALLGPGPGPVEISWRHEEDWEQPDLELHEGKDHVFFVTEGQATITLGGQMVAPHQISPGEWKAPRSTQSQTVEVGKGDLLFIPHGTVHRRSVKGRRLTMLLVSFSPGGPPAPAPAPVPAKAPAHP